MRITLSIIAMSALTACGVSDETISGYADQTAIYELSALQDDPAPFRASITFPEQGRVAGAGPCNLFAAEQISPYPWFELGPIAATRRACPDLDAEQQYFELLSAMTLAEVNGDVLILSNEAGQEMVFQRRQE